MLKELKYFLLCSFLLLIAFSPNSPGQTRVHLDFRFQSLTKDVQQPRKGDKVTFTIITEKRGTGIADKVRLVCKLRHFQVVDQEIDFSTKNTSTTTYVWSSLPGDQTFKCIIDSNNIYTETDENNNEAKLEFNVALPRLPNIPYKDFILIPDYSSSVMRFEGLLSERRVFQLPDLIATKITLDSNTNTANLYIRNLGSGFSANWEYKLAWGRSAPDEDSCEGAKSGIIKSYANFQVSCPLPLDFFTKYSDTNIQFKLTLDSKNKVDEVDEINNLYFESIRVHKEQPKIVIE
jgi:hypothetical protein